MASAFEKWHDGLDERVFRDAQQWTELAWDAALEEAFKITITQYGDWTTRNAIGVKIRALKEQK